MKYFEFNEPFFALVRAESIERARQIYYHVLGSLLRKEVEKSRDQAMHLFFEDEMEPTAQEINDFNKDSESVLMIDRGLI